MWLWLKRNRHWPINELQLLKVWMNSIESVTWSGGYCLSLCHLIQFNTIKQTKTIAESIPDGVQKSTSMINHRHLPWHWGVETLTSRFGEHLTNTSFTLIKYFSYKKRFFWHPHILLNILWEIEIEEIWAINMIDGTVRVKIFSIYLFFYFFHYVLLGEINDINVTHT